MEAQSRNTVCGRQSTYLKHADFMLQCLQHKCAKAMVKDACSNSFEQTRGAGASTVSSKPIMEHQRLCTEECTASKSNVFCLLSTCEAQSHSTITHPRLSKCTANHQLIDKHVLTRQHFEGDVKAPYGSVLLLWWQRLHMPYLSSTKRPSNA